MVKKVRDLSEQEFIDLIDSGRFRLKTREELKDEGWKLRGSGEDLWWEYDGSEAVDIYDKILDLHFEVRDILEVDIDDHTFKISNNIVDNPIDYYESLWFPMSMIVRTGIYVDPIVLDIPDENFLLL